MSSPIAVGYFFFMNLDKNTSPAMAYGPLL